MVQRRTNIGQLIAQLSPSESVVQGEPWALLGDFSMFRLERSNHHRGTEEVWICSSFSLWSAMVERFSASDLCSDG